MIDMREVRRLAAMGVPDGAGIRVTVWKVHSDTLSIGLKRQFWTIIIIDTNLNCKVVFGSFFWGICLMIAALGLLSYPRSGLNTVVSRRNL